jgi:hypothetical protein
MTIRVGLAGLLVAAVAGCGTDVTHPKQAAPESRETGESTALTKMTLKLPGMT